MRQIEVNGKTIELTDEGFLTNPEAWNRDFAAELAKEESIELTEKHFEVLEYLRSEHASGSPLTIRKVGKSGIVDIKGLYDLFPGGPLKKSSKIAGIPKPTSCV